jgi:hypothetical protein
MEVHHDDFEPVRKWMAESTGGSGEALVVFGREDVCRTTTAFFVNECESLLCRDDAIVLSVESDWVMFCSHEDEFEFGRRQLDRS